MADKTRIAILGGGAGALTTAFEITSSPGWQDKFDITVYQLGWRLGGKGASGRDEQLGNRILEHGLHIWFGFYQNAFRVIRLAYDEVTAKGLAPRSPFKTWKDAFTPQQVSSMLDVDRSIWSFVFPENDEIPGDAAATEGAVAPPAEPDTLALSLARFLVERWERHPEAHEHLRHAASSQPLEQPSSVVAGLLRFVLTGAQDVEHFLIGKGSLIRLVLRAMEALPMRGKREPKHLRAIADVIRFVAERLRKLFPDLSVITRDLRRLIMVTDSALAMLIGILEDDVLSRGFDSINDIDFYSWLKKHGALFAHPAIATPYDGAFAYNHGDPDDPDMEAGTMLRGVMLTLLGYSGSICFRMNAGMGDTIFTPLYLALKSRGVRFEFFHRVTDIKLTPDKKNVGEIRFDVQASVNSEVAARGGYEPLIDVEGLPCWPRRPLYDQLVQGEAMKDFNLESFWTPWKSGLPAKSLKLGQDFDKAVLAIPHAAFKFICPELVDANPKWRDMIDHVRSAQTHAVQLWFTKTAAELGWNSGVDTQGLPFTAACLSGGQEPFDTYCDMQQVLGRETWKPDQNVNAVGYFCDVVPNPPEMPPPDAGEGLLKSETERSRGMALEFIGKHLKTLLPASAAPDGSFDWNVVYDPLNRAGSDRFDAQYLRVNIDPSERYVLSLVGSSKYRLHPGESGYDNLVLAGDWTWTGLNCGCVEAAVISGRLASRAICGFPKFVYGADAKLAGLPEAEPPRIVTAAAASSNPVRELWQARAEAGLPPETAVIRRNAAITARYAQLYLDNSSVFKWAGMAAYASHRVGMALLPFVFRDADGVLTGLLSGGVLHDLEHRFFKDCDLIRATNNAVYRDIGWTHLAYLDPDGGLPAIERGLEGQPNSDDLREGWRKIDAGVKQNSVDLIWEGNKLLLWHEQHVTVEPAFQKCGRDYQKFLGCCTIMQYDADNLAFWSPYKTSFYLYMWTFGLPLLLRKLSVPDIVKIEQRWAWITQRALAIWMKLDKNDGGRSDQLRALIARANTVLVASSQSST